LKLGEVFGRYVRSQQAVEIFQQVLLAWLSKCEPIDRQAAFQPFETADLAAEGQ